MTAAEGAPELRVINQDATDEEIAALVAVISSLGAPSEPERKPASTWAAHTRKMRTTLRRGPGAWRASGLPHQ